MSDPITQEPEPFPEYDIAGIGTVVAHDSASYIVRMPNGKIVGYPAASGEASEANAEADINAALANPPPAVAPPVVLTPLQILGRLTPEEEAAFASSSDLAVQVVRNRLIAASEVRSDDPRTTEGRAILVAKGIITEARAAAIFA